ncbi:recombination regulator RecX [Achromobacter aloeverae]|uniref:Regulatory protein RecX n=1 Tax=Achromobacter aloeverae TaxID=1750518 RepID=A0A4Q1HQF6_9BURK|nr:recombination regulator RecX [Achromobacter aloeverae]RXN92921.1 recombination regulator RecX [Achromobacter aloeverae]
MVWGTGPSRPRRAGRPGADDDDGGFEQLARGRPSATEDDGNDAGEVYTRTSDRRSHRGAGRSNASTATATTDPSASADPSDATAPAPRRGPSLKARAVGFLSRREYARPELARKLAAYAEADDDLEKVLDDLEREGWLSTERYAQSLVHRRAERQGTARIVQELRAKGVTEAQVGELQQDLRATEYQRARVVWEKRYGERPADRAAYAKQARFLAGRGFAHDVIRRILGESDDE